MISFVTKFEKKREYEIQVVEDLDRVISFVIGKHAVRAIVSTRDGDVHDNLVIVNPVSLGMEFSCREWPVYFSVNLSRFEEVMTGKLEMTKTFGNDLQQLFNRK